MKTLFGNENSLTREWHKVDASDKVLGRMASRVASILRGKHKAIFSPHADTGDFVVVINAEKVQVSGKKEEEKLYWRHTSYPGGKRSVSLKSQRALYPERIIQSAVAGMLPKGPLGRKMLKKLKVYAGAEHPHGAQNPTELKL